MTAQRYVHDILQPHVLPLMQRLQEPFFNRTMLRFTRQGCHKTVSAQLPPFLSLPDPQISLQSSIFIERDHLGRRNGNPTSLNELESRFQQIWNEMPQDIIQNLYVSMLDRIASCIHAREGSTEH
ncbi:transposable element Tcb1 transposase [Trichonephila clavipes]|nr:transposable element Tcb1 transposase [Trichonephila clavipes]